MAVKHCYAKSDMYEFEYDVGTNTPVAGETIYVNGSVATEYATVHSWEIDAGAWATNDAAGTMFVYGCSAAFISEWTNGNMLVRRMADR